MKILTAVTGASGSIYAERLISELHRTGHEVHVIFSDTGRAVFEYETGRKPELFIEELGKPAPTVHDNSNLFAPPASGSFRMDAMIIAPSSMSTIGGLAAGSLGSLIGRSADVCLKERRRLIIVPRETPLSRIHLKNMLELTEAGAVILPAMPGFYNRPASVDDIVNFTVARILDQLEIENDLSKRWSGG